MYVCRLQLKGSSQICTFLMLAIRVVASNCRARVSNKNQRKTSVIKIRPFSYVSSYQRGQIHPLNSYLIRANFLGFSIWSNRYWFAQSRWTGRLRVSRRSALLQEQQLEARRGAKRKEAERSEVSTSKCMNRILCTLWYERKKTLSLGFSKGLPYPL